MKAKATIYGIGRDATRPDRSAYYRLERATLKIFRYKKCRAGQRVLR